MFWMYLLGNLFRRLEDLQCTEYISHVYSKVL